VTTFSEAAAHSGAPAATARSDAKTSHAERAGFCGGACIKSSQRPHSWRPNGDTLGLAPSFWKTKERTRRTPVLVGTRGTASPASSRDASSGLFFAQVQSVIFEGFPFFTHVSRTFPLFSSHFSCFFLQKGQAPGFSTTVHFWRIWR
jgi:hypothetical protein